MVLVIYIIYPIVIFSSLITIVVWCRMERQKEFGIIIKKKERKKSCVNIKYALRHMYILFSTSFYYVNAFMYAIFTEKTCRNSPIGTLFLNGIHHANHIPVFLFTHHPSSAVHFINLYHILGKSRRGRWCFFLIFPENVWCFKQIFSYMDKYAWNVKPSFLIKNEKTYFKMSSEILPSMLKVKYY